MQHHKTWKKVKKLHHRLSSIGIKEGRLYLASPRIKQSSYIMQSRSKIGGGMAIDKFCCVDDCPRYYIDF